MKKIAIVQSSLREGSHTDIVCRAFETYCVGEGVEVEYVDLRKVEMEFCNGGNLEHYPKDMQEAFHKIEKCEGVIFGMPVYQYTMSGVLKNFIDICGASVSGKPVGIIVNSGGPNTYMASRDLFNALQFEYSTTNIMPTPFTWFMDFKDGELINEKVREKLIELAQKIKSL